MSASLGALADGARLVVVVGPGGVGKTTVAASLAADAARRGRRAIVLTIDPARRLADALGLDALDDTERAVALPEHARGSLDAAMLDTKASFDALIGRIAPGPDARRAILDNEVYAAFSRTLARSHGYVAMERLGHVLGDDRFDLCVLDTPPATAALDILDAPERLGDFLDERVLASFVGPMGSRGASGAALRLVSLLAGSQLARDLRDFLRLFYELRHGFARRAETIRAALTSPSTRVVLVTTPEPLARRDALHMAAELARRDLHVHALIANRAFVPQPGSGAPVVAPEPETSPVAPAADETVDFGAALDAADALRRDIAAWNERARRTLGDLAHELEAQSGRGPREVLLPLLLREARELECLALLATGALFVAA